MKTKKAKRQHSPGPWSILDIPTHDTISVYQSRNPIRNFHIATVMDYASANKEASEAEFQRCLANAQLIAAAPEMLEALEAVKDRLESWIDHHQIRINSKHIEDTVKDINCRDNYKALVNLIDFVLKKARGEK